MEGTKHLTVLHETDDICGYSMMLYCNLAIVCGVDVGGKGGVGGQRREA